MRKHTLAHTNILLCTIITIGFIATTVIGYQSNTAIFERDAEHVSTLASDGIYYQIDRILSEPVNVSLTMANDSLLKNFLTDEEKHLEDAAYIKQIRDYLYAYREKYAYDSVFLVSAQTNRYYHYEGLDRVLTPDHSENMWYYEFLERGEEYELNVDNDEATDNSITAFVNCKIQDKTGATIGVIGVGMKVDSLQALLKDYDEKVNVAACLIDGKGIVQLSSKRTGHEHVNFFEDGALHELKAKILKKQDGQQTFRYSDTGVNEYVVTRYIPSMKWHLIVEKDMRALNDQLNRQLYTRIGIIALIILLVIFTITGVLKQYRAQILKLSMSQQQDYQKMLDQMAAGLYENIFEIDLTHNCGGENMAQYFESMGLPKDTPFDEGLREIARTQVKEEYAQSYLERFLPERLLQNYSDGISSLSYDFPTVGEDGEYHWVRIAARIFYWESDRTVRVISYRKNINAEKKRELSLLAKSQQDSLTGLYNKGVTENMISQVLNTADNTVDRHAMLMFDIDNFKSVNDQYGHIMGDNVIAEFAAELKNHFRDADIVGRIGGDEFAVLMVNFKDNAMLSEKLERFCSRIARKDFGQQKGTSIFCSIGAAIYPDHGTSFLELFENADKALYYAKAHGKCSFYILEDSVQNSTISHVNSKDFKTIIDYATDGMAKFACFSPPKLLYFNQKLVDLLGSSSQALSAVNLNPLSCVHPDDLQRVMDTLQEALPERKPAAVLFRIRHGDGHYFPVKLQVVFVRELYEDHYPIFYAVYSDMTEFVSNFEEEKFK